MKKRSIAGKTAGFLLILLILLTAAACKGADSDPGETEAVPTAEPTPTPKTDYVLALEEKYKDYQETEYGLDITLKENMVGICYSTWFNPVVSKNGTKKIYNITELLAQEEKGEEAKWGPVNAFHFWAKPAVGYYRSDNKDVIRTHMTQLQEARVDFIIIDNTNANSKTWGPGQKNGTWDLMVTQSCTALLDTILEMRAEGLKTPYVVFWNRVDETGWGTPTQVYEEFMKDEKYQDCWVYWEGKPLMLVNLLSNVTSFKYRKELTLRQQSVAIITSSVQKNEWSFLYDGKKPCKDADGYYEHISVYAARQTTYMSETQTAIGRKGGVTFYKQWKRAFDTHPKVITLTWWNEWIAQRFDVDGKNAFVDNYNEEYSRDIEPMEGGHGDQYYQWMKQYIEAYKTWKDCPVLVEPGYEDQIS